MSRTILSEEIFKNRPKSSGVVELWSSWGSPCCLETGPGGGGGPKQLRRSAQKTTHARAHHFAHTWATIFHFGARIIWFFSFKQTPKPQI